MLQRAFAVSFCPEHQVELSATIPASPGLANYDALVIDAAAIREDAGSGGNLDDVARAWSIPTVWLEESDAPAPSRRNLVVVRKPIGRDGLLAALTRCRESESSLAPPEHSAVVAGSAMAHAQAGVASDKGERAQAPIIDLVDVVEESAGKRS